MTGVSSELTMGVSSCKLGLDEAEPNVRFLLIVRAKFDLRSCYCSDRGGQIVTRHVLRIRESW
jgi:hypothetical protein